MLAATLFDFNGVLVDDEHVHCAAFCDTLRPLGIELSERDYWDKYLGFDDIGAFEAILRDHGRAADPDFVKSLVQAKRPHYMSRARNALSTFEKAAELVRARRLRGPVGVVSGALEEEIEFGLGALGVRDQVGIIISAEHTKVSKPDPDGYLMGLEWLRPQGISDPKTVLVVEDSPAGIEAAKLAGMTVIAVAHSYSEDELKKTRADLVVPRLSQVLEGPLQKLEGELFR